MNKAPAVYRPSRTTAFKQALVTAAVVMAASAANAADIDITPITSMITSAITAATAIGIGFLGFTAGMAIYKKLRGAT